MKKAYRKIKEQIRAEQKIEDEKIADLVTRFKFRMCMFNRKRGPFYEWLNEFEYYIGFFEVNEKQERQLFKKMITKNIHFDVEVKFPLEDLSKYPHEEVLIKYNEVLASTTKEHHLRRHQFMSRCQYIGETIEQYAINLRKIHSKCFYADVSTLKIRTQFVQGLLNDFITDSLIDCYRQLTFNDVVKKALEIEEEVAARFDAEQVRCIVRRWVRDDIGN